MFTSELSRLQSARLVQRYAMDIMRMRPEKGMDDDEDEEEPLGHAARRGEGGGWKGGGQVPPRTDVVLNDEPSRDGDFVAVFADGLSRQVLASLEGRHAGGGEPLRGAREAAAPGAASPAARGHV
ncbi:secretin isoform X2 [Lethenteron reissneri]|nr:secretin isoform X2 [Lethenteron reissneri]